MEYHLKLFDTWMRAKWTHKTKEGLRFTMAPQTDFKQRLKARHGSDTDLLDEVLEVRRRVIRYDNGEGVPVYYIRLARVRDSGIKAFSPSQQSSRNRRKPRYILGKGLSKWVVVENGILEGDDPWAEYVPSKEERDAIAWFAGPKRELRLPIVDPGCVALLRGAENPTPSASGSVSRDPGTSLHPPAMVPKIHTDRTTRRTSTRTNLGQEKH